MFDRLKMQYFLGLFSGAYSDLDQNEVSNEFDIDDKHSLNTKKTPQTSAETKEVSDQAFKIREQIIKEYLLKHLFRKEDNGTYSERSSSEHSVQDIFMIEVDTLFDVKRPKKFGTRVIDLPETDPRSRTIYNEYAIVDITEQELNTYVRLLAESGYDLHEELLKNAKQSSQVENKTESFGLWGTKTTNNLKQNKVPTSKPKPTRFRDKI